MDVGIFGDGHADEFGSEVGSAEDDFFRNDAVFEDALLVINVIQKKIQCRDALHEPGFDSLPLVGGNHAREGIERKNALGAFLVAVNGESNSLFKKEEFEAANF